METLTGYKPYDSIRKKLEHYTSPLGEEKQYEKETGDKLHRVQGCTPHSHNLFPKAHHTGKGADLVM